MCRAHAFKRTSTSPVIGFGLVKGRQMTTLTEREPLTPGQELVQGAYESDLEPIRHPRRKSLQEAYGFDDVAIVPGVLTINPELTDVSTMLAGQRLEMPILASAMDAVVDPDFAIEVGRRGGMAVLNLEGLQCRFDDPAEVLEEVAGSDTETATEILQRAYTTPIRDELIGLRVQQIKDGGVAAAVSITPPNAKRLAPAIKEAAPDVFVVQSTVTTARHYSRSQRGLILSELIAGDGDPDAGREHGGIRCVAGTDGRGDRRIAGRGRSRRGLHVARGVGNRRPASVGDDRVRLRP